MNLRDQLIRHEGEVLHLYYDSADVPTIGIGCNLRDVRVPDDIASQITITPDGSRRLFELRLAVAESALEIRLPWVTTLGEPRRAVLVNMAFNLGIAGLLNFHDTLDAVYDGRWDDAARHMLASKWARQVGHRARELAQQMRTGEWP